LPLSRIELKVNCTPFLFAVWRDELVYSSPYKLGMNASLIGLQYPTYIFCKRNDSNDGYINVAHEFHDYADLEEDSLLEKWINKRQFVVDRNGKILNMSSFTRLSASIFYCDYILFDDENWKALVILMSSEC